MKKEDYLSIAEKYYEEYESLKKEANFYDYEKHFVNLWQRLGSEYMENQLNESVMTNDRRKKKL
jgi:hypothetical protein